MSAADFDDIFGEDPKVDATAAPTLTDVNLEDEFGGDPSGKVAKSADAASAQGSNWEHIGSREQDEFLSWLDDGGSSQAAPTGTSSIPEPPASSDYVPPPAPVTPASAAEFGSVSLDDDNDDFDKMLEGSSSAVPPVNAPSFDDNDDLDRMLDRSNASLESAPTPVAIVDSIAPNNGNDFDAMLQSANAPVATSSAISLDDDDDLEQIVKSAGASTFVPVGATPVGNISLDDDDDDDLEKIIQQANKQANASSSRENSNSSLQIKSQVQAQHKPHIGTKKQPPLP